MQPRDEGSGTQSDRRRTANGRDAVQKTPRRKQHHAVMLQYTTITSGVHRSSTPSRSSSSSSTSRRASSVHAFQTSVANQSNPKSRQDRERGTVHLQPAVHCWGDVADPLVLYRDTSISV